MGITKRPTSDCSDEILAADIDEIVDNTVYSDTNDESDHEIVVRPPATRIDFAAFLRTLSPELRMLFNNEYNNSDADYKPDYKPDNKSVSHKKINISQMGRKKANRAQNENYLLSLGAEFEDEIFFNENKNGFTKAINRFSFRTDIKELINEEIDDFMRIKRNKGSTAKSNAEKKSKRSIRPDLAFKNLTTSQKSLFKQKSLPFAAIDHLETEVVQYFSLAPKGIYTSAPLPSYNRMLLHSIVRYYSLDATSVNSRGRRAQKIVQVRNSRFDDFKPPCMSLLKYISSLNSNC